MILIADSGSTKCDWIPVDKTGAQVLEKITTKGLNPAILDRDTLKQRIFESPALADCKDAVTLLYFYGAGCGTATPKQMLKEVLLDVFKAAHIEVEEDTMAAVRATINTPFEAAVVCILGTGSNCSYYNGKTLFQNVESLGYSVMDDASGNYFGRALIRGYYFNHMPENIKAAFESQYNLDADYLKYQLYKQPNPNAFLAGFAEFLVLNKTSEYMQGLINDGLRLFFENLVMQYKKELEDVPLHFVGSIAFYIQDDIKAMAKEFGFKTGNFERRPIDGLVKFHTSQL
ncbi:N-acetylglucosamine kinase [Mangrovimonas yunxiaonensis]|uniref:N-acetylglucosamine kinase n=1 Tax=Mangrovimonas yunxiaonensis TaxID=1197477 RepID=A0A084THK7_9FLAO|nr:N-acetylglucosamine kinase [Mangrovimonas yunxiaonensis]KFB00193.1 N-acetylglucosamine kinase [Mangrovimonas yunxiaonensis]GGH42449.1 hypothetical protein GCM10011364_13960 [Mangrovimonas yunxiaonensis]